MSHHHHHDRANYNRAFAWGVALNVAYIAVEVAFGVLVNSLALLADAGHNLSDVLGLILAWGAHYVTQFKPTQRRTYGWHSSTILAALTNALILLMAIGGIVWEAMRRFLEPQPVSGTTVIWVAAVGMVVNGVTAWLFAAGRHGDLNIRGAFLHMAADAGVSFGVVLAGLVILASGWQWVDPLTSLVVAAVIFVGTWGLFRESVDLALQAVPKQIDPAQVADYLRSLPGVVEVHDLHIWAMSTTQTALTAHLVRPLPDAGPHNEQHDGNGDDDRLLASACHELHERFGIEHTTLQLERDATAARCRLAASDTL